MDVIKKLHVKVILVITVLVCFATAVAIGLRTLPNWAWYDFRHIELDPAEMNKVFEVTSMDYEVKKELDDYTAEGYDIENLTEHLYGATYQVIFQASRTDSQGRLLSASLVAALVDVDSRSVLDLESYVSYFTMQNAIQACRITKVVQVFLSQFPDAEYSVGFEQDGPKWIITWEFHERALRILFDMHGWIQDVMLVGWDVERPIIAVKWFAAVEISRETEAVQRYLDQHPQATFDVRQEYVENSTVFYVSEDWIVLRVASGPVPERVSGILGGNYCWSIHWSDPASMIPHIVNVSVNVETGEVLSIAEAW